MKINWKKVLLVAGPLVGLAGLIAWSNKSARAAASNPNTGGGSSGGGTGGTTRTGGGIFAAPVFPLQVGSNNAAVKTLQGYLGVTQDGIFGSDTESALYLSYCMTSVPDQATLNYIASFKGLPANCGYPGGTPSTEPVNPYTPSVDSVTGLMNI